MIGRDFDVPLLRQAARMDDAVVVAALEELVRRRLLRIVGERFAFAHDRIRDVAYGELIPPRRRRLHDQAADAILACHEAALEPHCAALGAHCYVLLGEADRAAAVVEDASRIARRSGDRGRLGHVVAGQAFHQWWAGRPAEARDLAVEAEAIGCETGDVPLTITGTLYQAYACQAIGDYRAAQDVLEPLIAKLDGAAARERYGQHLFPYVGARFFLAFGLAFSGHFDHAFARAREALRFAEEIDHRYSVVAARWVLGEIHAVKGEVPEAAEHLDAALALCREWEVMFARPAARGCLGYVHALGGRADGRRLIDEAVAEQARFGFRAGYSRLVAMQVEARILAGEIDEAARLAHGVLAYTRERGERGWEALALRLVADVAAHAARRDVPAAETHYRHALTLAGDLGMRPLVARCYLGLGLLYRDIAQPRHAVTYLDVAVAELRSLGMTRWLAEASAARAALHV